LQPVPGAIIRPALRKSRGSYAQETKTGNENRARNENKEGKRNATNKYMVRDLNLSTQGRRLASSPSELEHTICIFTRTVLLIYFKCQNIQVKASVSRRMASSSMPKSMAPSSVPRYVAPKWCHVASTSTASTSTATLNQLANLGAMTYGAETCYLSAVGHGANPLGPKTQFISLEI